jgi:hypothetical protein
MFSAVSSRLAGVSTAWNAVEATGGQLARLARASLVDHDLGQSVAALGGVACALGRTAAAGPGLVGGVVDEVVGGGLAVAGLVAASAGDKLLGGLLDVMA